MKILGIETSCDETAAAVYDSEHGLQSNALYSQVRLHERYGGVVPELASRSHVEQINVIVQRALEDAHVNLSMIDVVAVTTGPGLFGSLLVGVCFAKGIAYANKCKLTGVNHLEGHIFSVHLEHEVPFPYVCLVASGGHTALYLVRDYGAYDLIGQTADDAAGEAFDKIAKLLGFGYPGGPHIERLAREGGFRDYRHYPRLKQQNLMFSFSGLKTAVLYDLVRQGAYDMTTKTVLRDDQQLKVEVASSLLVAIGDIVLDRIQRACEQYAVKAITFVGGVACNTYLRERLAAFAKKRQYVFASPSRILCTDNAAMIAYVGNYKALRGQFDDWTLDATPTPRRTAQ